ncbi:methyltransferase domain-containing protein [Lederbergia sp. NSJ-179]|uniref:methyltransferase domain-containing protein n=1 Tax=Lederbergia sp. NSJ-179 TaxID=2931402 RepID=UPI001FD4254E|nr:methyltransferase domain-containing protein [Lederbergia sp. NSJ-179]MCJ7841980.1 methyltransferase domain-containing protein [Lederbergia sp. NSJ-179]
MNNFHENNRMKWNIAAERWNSRDISGGWKNCHRDPTIAFHECELEFISSFVGDLTGKRVCVLGSGDNYTTFALAGMGAEVTSVDISEKQLEIAANRAKELDLKNITFVRADVSALPLESESYDFACSSGVVAIWISNLDKYYGEANRILKQGSYFMISETHPIRRILKQEQNDRLSVEYHYFNNGPHKYEYSLTDGKGIGVADEAVVQGNIQYEFTWRISDYVNSMINVGFQVQSLQETKSDHIDQWKEKGMEALPQALVLISKKL